MRRDERIVGPEGPGGIDEWKLTACALGELDPTERAAIEERVGASPELAREVAEIAAFAEQLAEEMGSEWEGALRPEQRAAIVGAANSPTASQDRAPRPMRMRGWATALAASLVVVLAAWAAIERLDLGREELPPFSYQVGSEPSLSAPATGGRAAQKAPLAAEVVRGLQDLGYSSGEPPKSIRIVDYNAFEGVPAGFRFPRLPGEGSDRSEPPSTEAYDHRRDNPFRSTADEPLSTFSIDVDTASYANVRRFLSEGRLPPPDAVRIEELLNYFRWDDPEPRGSAPFAVHVEVASAPWAPEHRLARIGIRARSIDWSQRQPSNLVFLIDVSGSMQSPDKLPLLVSGLSMLVRELDERDRVALVVYAGSSGVVLPPTPANADALILSALESLSAGGSTNGGAGIELAYSLAQQHFVEGGVNRVVLCTDGDFNVGTSDRGSLVRLVQEKAKSGVFLTVLGFGTGNLKDSAMEELADKGNGNYAYVDSLAEARRVLVEEVGGTLVTVAKDVKIQLELNPNEVAAWRLVGYENRLLANQDFADDTKDAGEVGAGHSLTVLYELVPRGLGDSESTPLRYRESGRATPEATSGELFHLRLRYKQPDGDVSRLIEEPVRDSGLAIEEASADLRFAAAVAGFGMLLRDAPDRGGLTWDLVRRLALEGTVVDEGGYRRELAGLIETARHLSERARAGGNPR